VREPEECRMLEAVTRKRILNTLQSGEDFNVWKSAKVLQLTPVSGQ
jgi:hypothetical protein